MERPLDPPDGTSADIKIRHRPMDVRRRDAQGAINPDEEPLAPSADQ